MSNLKRDAVKYVRDRAKSAYTKDSVCRMCGATEELEFHHYTSMTAMLDRWLRKEKINPSDIVEHRDRFIEEHYDQIYNKTVTLCKSCHSRLHKVYGQKPGLGTATKQERWVEKQRIKNGLV
jgi:hypothetical protein